MAIATLTIDINARMANLEQDMGKVSHLAEQTAGKMSSAFAAAQGALVGLGVAAAAINFGNSIKGAIDAADGLNDLSQKIGVSVEDLAGLKLVAEQSGTSLEGLGDGMKKLAKYMTEHSDKLQAAGITATDAKGAFAQLADQFSKMEDGTQKTALAMTIFGKAGADMIPVLNQGGAEIEKMIEKGQRLNPITKEMAKNADQFNDSLTELKMMASSVAISFAADLLPSLNKFLEQLIEGQKIAGGFVQALVILGTMNPFKTAAESVKSLTEELDALLARKAEIGNGTGFIGRGFAGNLDNEIANIKKKLEFAKLLQRQDLPQASYSNEDRGASRRGGSTKILSLLDKPGKKGKVDNSADQESSYLSSLRNQLNAAKGDISEYSRVLEAVTSGSAKKFSQPTKDTALALAKQTDELKAATKATEEQAKIQKKLDDANKSATKSIEEFTASQTHAIESIQGQTADLGQNPADAKRLDALRKITTDIEDEKRKVTRTLSEVGDTAGIEKQTTALDELGRKLKTDTIKALEEMKAKQDGLNASWEYGAGTAMRNYIEEVSNVAKSTENLMSRAFKGMEDALVNFVQTGKLNFTDLANSIVSDLIRIQIQQSVTKPLAQALGGIGDAGGISSFLGHAKDFFSGDFFPSFAVGTNYVPHDMLAKIHQGERIVPAAENVPGIFGGGAGVTVNATIDARGADQSVVPQINAALAAMEQRIYRSVPSLVSRQQVRNRISPMSA